MRADVGGRCDDETSGKAKPILHEAPISDIALVLRTTELASRGAKLIRVGDKISNAREIGEDSR
jgi:hypothetical protein